MWIESLKPFYQPIVDTKNEGQVVGYEATIRGHDESGETVFYKEIYDKALAAGKERDMDWVVRDIEIQEFVYRLRPNERLFVNVRPSALDQPLFYEDVDISRVVLEITETEDVTLNDRHYKRLELLCKKGMQIAIDDFGIGYTNFKLIHKIGPTYIKLDQLYAQSIRQKKTQQFVRAVASFCNELGTTLIAEGVEEQETKHLLTDCGVRYMQGFLFGKPMEASSY